MALNRVEPPRQFTAEMAQQWYKLQESVNNELVNVGFSNVLWVDQVEGNDDTAQRGSLAFKYATIQAALDAAQAGDTVWVSPGTYIEDLYWPRTVDGVTLRGCGKTATTIINATDDDTLTIIPTVDIAFVAVMDLSLINTAATEQALLIYGGVAPGLGDGGYILLQSLNIVSTNVDAVIIWTAQNVKMIDILLPDQRLRLFNTVSSTASICRFGSIELDYHTTGGWVEPDLGRANGLIIDSTQAADVTVLNLGVFVGTDDTQINDLNGTLIDQLDLGNPIYGGIMFAGRITGEVDVTFDFDDGAAEPMPLILDYARVSGGVNFGRTTGAGGTELGYCRALQAMFYTVTPTVIVADSLAVMDLRGAQFNQEALFSDDTGITGTAGVFDRTVWYDTLAETTAGPDAITFQNAGGPIPYPVGTVDYSVSVEATVLAQLPIAVPTAGKIDVSVSILATAAQADPIRVCIIRPYD